MHLHTKLVLCSDFQDIGFVNEKPSIGQSLSNASRIFLGRLKDKMYAAPPEMIHLLRQRIGRMLPHFEFKLVKNLMMI